MEYAGKVGWITGAANGFGAAVARRWASMGAQLVLSDIEEDNGKLLADEIGATFVRCDVTSYDDVMAAVEAVTTQHGRLDIAFLNAGISTGTDPGPNFNLELYRRAMGVNLDGVVFGMHAAMGAMAANGGGEIVATASLAGLTPVPFDPIYATNKHAVVGLVRSVGAVSNLQNIRVNGLCPGFADTRIVAPIREVLQGQGLALIPVEQVVDTVISIIEGGNSGECWFVQLGRDSEPFGFRNIPGPK